MPRVIHFLFSSFMVQKNKVLEIVFSGRVGIGCVCVCVFCLYFMIRKTTLEGFTSIWEAKYEGFSLEHFKKT